VWLVLERLLVPSVRWFLRRRVNRVLDELNTRLRIHIQPFKLTKRKVLIDRILYDPEVMEAAQALAVEKGMPRELVMAKVERYAKEIVPSFNAYVYFRVGYWLARSIARSLYRVRLGYANEAALEEIEPDSTIVFVMNHRSNMDYILVAYLVAEQTALSYAVGEWAALVRLMGAYFVRRKSRNALYRRVLARYVAMATAEGVTQAVYPEGGLSRDGRLGDPKLGLLDYMLRRFDPQGARDLVLVPVGLNYDRVLEDRTLLLDRSPGSPPRKEGVAALGTFLGFLARNLRLWLAGSWYRFGYACVNFGTPVSMKRYLANRDTDLRRLDRDARFDEVERLAHHLMEGVGRVIPVVPVSLVAGVFMEDPARAWTKLELKAEVQRRSERLSAAGVHVYVPRADGDYAIDVGLRMLTLRHLVSEQDGLYQVESSQQPLLRYYANSISHLLEIPELVT
jgi:glycerol-3-phosphate O-acyltransferase